MGRIRSIVLVENNPLDAMIFRQALATSGQEWSLVHCLDGVGALTYLQYPKEELPALIVIDIDHARSENLTLLKQLKQNPLTRHVAVVVLSQGCSRQETADYRQLDIDDYLIKPADYDLLGKEIVHCLKRWTAKLIAAA